MRKAPGEGKPCAGRQGSPRVLCDRWSVGYCWKERQSWVGGEKWSARGVDRKRLACLMPRSAEVEW
jgi:hypothetical protein